MNRGVRSRIGPWRLASPRCSQRIRHCGAIRGNVYISVEGGRATLYGAVRNAGIAREIAEAVGYAPGIQSVSNMIEVTGARLY